MWGCWDLQCLPYKAKHSVLLRAAEHHPTWHHCHAPSLSLTPTCLQHHPQHLSPLPPPGLILLRCLGTGMPRVVRVSSWEGGRARLFNQVSLCKQVK